MAAYFSEQLLTQRYEATRSNIVTQWYHMGAREGDYYLQCPCNQDCYHVDWHEAPRLSLEFCLYPGELDQFIVYRPMEQYGVKFNWHCLECSNEISCGYPPHGTE